MAICFCDCNVCGYGTKNEGQFETCPKCGSKNIFWSGYDEEDEKEEKEEEYEDWRSL